MWAGSNVYYLLLPLCLSNCRYWLLLPPPKLHPKLWSQLCCTSVSYDIINYPIDWQSPVCFHGFERIGASRVTSVASPEFKSCGHQWRLGIFPCGDAFFDEEGMIGVYLSNRSRKGIEVEFSFLNIPQPLLQSDDGSQTISRPIIKYIVISCIRTSVFPFPSSWRPM